MDIQRNSTLCASRQIKMQVGTLIGIGQNLVSLQYIKRTIL